MATINAAWFVPFSFFPRTLNVVPLEDLIWGIIAAYLSVACYEYFPDEGKEEILDKRMEYLIAPMLVALAVFAPLAMLVPEVSN